MRKILFALFLLTQLSYAADSLTLSSIFKEFKYYPRGIRGIRSMDDGQHFTRISGNSIKMYDYKRGEEQSTIFNGANHREEIPSIREYSFSKQEDKLLIATKDIPQYRHSFFATYYVYDIATDKLTVLNSGSSVMLATFSPDGNKIAYVFENNLYYYNLENDRTIQVTTDGKQNAIINGTTDWVYEEEFAFTEGFHWSPNSDKIAFYRFNESNVKEFTMQYFGNLYPENYTFKYPKAGEANSVVEIWIHHVTNQSNVKADIGMETDIYIPRIKWTQDNDKLAIVRLNRLQNKVDILIANQNGTTSVLFTDENPYYISEVDDDYILFLENGNEFLVKSEADGYIHYYRYSMKGELINQVTSGQWDMDIFYGIDQKNKTMYYRSAEGISYEKQVYSIQLDGSGKKQLTHGNGIHSANFSNDFSYYIHTYTNSTTPLITDLYNRKGNMVRVLEDNAAVNAALAKIELTKKEFIQVKTDNDIDLNGYIIKPADFDSTIEYPILMYVYGGPEAQDAINAYDGYWDIWFNYLTKQGYIVACFDNRGTDSRGQAFKKSTYMQLGNLESIDQMNIAKYLGNLPYVNAKRIGIIGWSYGGYLSSLCLFKGEGLFSTAIAIAPVTNWRNYDNIYTERFMRTPQENPKGYDDNSPVNYAHLMEGNFLLVHGMADDNVHLQNSVDLSEKLIQYNKQFDMLYYPNRNHSIYGNGARLHLFTKLTDYILENL